MNERNYDSDIFRILCCVGVLIYHTVDDVLGVRGGTYVLYYGASFCVPGFFLLSGYLIARKANYTIGYYEDKVRMVAFKLFGWVIFWSVIHFIRTSEITDVWNNFLAGAKAGGILPVAWFLFTYMILLITSYPLIYAKKKANSIFSIVVIIYMVLICLGFGSNIVNSRPQSLWIHLYLGYFALGMVLSNVKIEDKKTRYFLLPVCMVLLCCCSIYYTTCYQTGAPHQHYGFWYYTLWLISIFILCSMININKIHICRALKRTSDNTFVVYLGHLPILLYLTERRPLQSMRGAIIMILFLFASTNIMAEVFRKLPLLRKTV